MNFNYSYRSFLITSLLTGSLVLFLYSIKLKGEIEEEEETYNMVVTEEELIPEETQIASLTPEKVKIETNRAYNEAEKFISEIENENRELTEETEGAQQEISENEETADGGSDYMAALRKKKPKELKKKDFSNSKSSKSNTAVVRSGNRNTTISYQLVNRKDIDLPNPVYTCDGFGKVVISIEVNASGRVVKSSYSKGASTTTNQCLIDSALEYASQARFNTEAGKTSQLGTITFNFPGQN
ncbi:energy transducer TonB [Aequorivita echinoideorum]|uniref:TonB family C-terminal domain-containing protein n=1 Tax=Aequorivita echinoideorum TaxID=1549647 RepID=A0ABS5S121_9FLAO|nr:hypothetical protein [Aequorivita echinoideorum]MBT0606875.1 hypothetical protein [Aequorivita echinoideorum]